MHMLHTRQRPEIGSKLGIPLEYMKLNGTFLPLKTSLISFLQYNVYYELEGSQEAVLS